MTNTSKIHKMTIAATFSCSTLSREARAYEGRPEFKRFFVERARQLGFIAGSRASIQVEARHLARWPSYDTDPASLLSVVTAAIHEPTSGRVSACDGTAPTDPECRPDEDDPTIWIKVRGVQLRDKSGPLVIGELPASMAGWPAQVREELAAMRIHARVEWKQSYREVDDATRLCDEQGA